MRSDLGAITALPLVVVSARVSSFDISKLEPCLSDIERARAARFRQRDDANRFVLAHSLKRFLLSGYLNLPALDLSFGADSYGKPYCQQMGAPYFNISHSNDWVVIGVSTMSDIGVDIEFSRDIDRHAIADRVCNLFQLKQFQAAGSTEDMFLCFWTQKEAIAKACGKGISVGLTDISCSGHLGSEEVVFLQQRYWLWTDPWQDVGTVCIASASGGSPRYFKATQFDGVHFSFLKDELVRG